MNISQKLYHNDIRQAFEKGQSAGIQEGRDQVKKELQGQALEARIKLVNAVGQALNTQSSLLNGLAASLGNIRVL